MIFKFIKELYKYINIDYVSNIFIFSLYLFYKYNKINNSIYIYSTILCIILFLPFILYINIVNLDKNTEILIFFDLFIIVISFTLWIISIYYKKTLFINLFIIIIIIVNIHLLYIVNSSKIHSSLKNLSIFGISYLLFHHIFIDFIYLPYLK